MVILAVRLVAAAAGQKVKIPVVALLGVVVVMVAWAVDHLLVMAAAAMASWVQLAALRLRPCLRFSPLPLAAVIPPWVQPVGVRLRRFSPLLLAAAARPCLRTLTALAVVLAAVLRCE